MNKKAITPIVSTFLLIIFAVGLGTLVMSWGNSENGKSITSCDNTQIEITKIDSLAQICMNSDKVSVLIENNGKSHIQGIKQVILTDEEVFTDELMTVILPGEYKKLDLPSHNLENSKVLKIRLIPITEEDTCVDKRIEMEKLFGCE